MPGNGRPERSRRTHVLLDGTGEQHGGTHADRERERTTGTEPPPRGPHGDEEDEQRRTEQGGTRTGRRHRGEPEHDPGRRPGGRRGAEQPQVRCRH